MGAFELSTRPVIAASWHRANQYGLHPGVSIESSSLEDVDRHSRLMHAASPVLDDVAQVLEGTGFVVVLADRESRLLDLRCGTSTVHSLLERLGVVVGRSVNETEIGTNSIATALEVGAGVTVHGEEHFIESLKQFSCYGQPVFHPITHRLEGVLDITCKAHDATPLLAPFLRRAGREIEVRLLGGARAAEQQLFTAFQSVQARHRTVPVVALSDGVFLANEAAVELLRSADHAILRGLAVDAAKIRTEQRLRLSSGQEVTASVTAVADGALFTLETLCSAHVVAPPRRRMAAVAVCGESGSGCTSTATELMADVDNVAWFDAADIVALGEREWLSSLEGRLLAGVPTVIEAVHLMPQSIARRVSAALRSTTARVVLTGAPLDRLHDEAAGLVARCVDRIELAPLRDRRAEIPELVASMLVELGAARELRFTPGALEALAGQPWPGNLRELESVVREVARRWQVGDVALHDLPEKYRNRARSRVLTPMEQAERDAIVEALRATKGNKLDAAAHLGISRTTLYRMIRRYGIVPPASTN